MKSSNAQILNDLQRYRRIAADVTAQSEKRVIDILDACRKKLVDQEAQRKKARFASLELLVKHLEELNQQEKDLLQKITETETQKQQIKSSPSSSAKKQPTARRHIEKQLDLNFENQITFMRIRATKNTLGEDDLCGKSLEALLEEEKQLRQEILSIEAQQSQAHTSLSEEEHRLDEELAKLQEQRDRLSREINSNAASLKSHSIGTTPETARRDLQRLKQRNKAKSVLRNKNLLECLTPEDRNVVETYFDTAAIVTIEGEPPGYQIKNCQFPHLFRALYASITHPISPTSPLDEERNASSRRYAQALAEGLGPSIVADKQLEKIILQTRCCGPASHYTIHSTLTNKYCVTWEKSVKKVLFRGENENQGPGREPFTLVNDDVLATLEQILTQEPQISFPDLCIRMSQCFPDATLYDEYQKTLMELKRLHEETPEQVLITEQRYFKQEELKQLEDNARLEREEIARQAQLEREEFARQAQLEREEIARQARLDREQAEYYAQQELLSNQRREEQEREAAVFARMQAEQQQREYNRAIRQSAEAEEKAERARKRIASKKCATCIHSNKCSLYLKSQGTGYDCAAFRPR